MDAFFAPLQFDIDAIMQQDVQRVVAAFRVTEQWITGSELLRRLDPARNYGLRAQLTAIERACRQACIEARMRRVAPRSFHTEVMYRRLL